MCGEIPLDCSAYTVTVTLGQNETQKLIRLPRIFENVIEVRLDEYAIRAPNNSSVAPMFWHLKFRDLLATDHITDNQRSGYPIVIDNATLTHVYFQRPRVIAHQQHKGLQQFQLELQRPDDGAIVFEEMILYLTLVVRDNKVDYSKHKARMLLQPPTTNHENDWRNSEFQTEVSALVDVLRNVSQHFSAPNEPKCSRK